MGSEYFAAGKQGREIYLWLFPDRTRVGHPAPAAGDEGIWHHPGRESIPDPRQQNLRRLQRDPERAAVRLLLPSKIGGVLIERPALMNYELAEGEFTTHKGL